MEEEVVKTLKQIEDEAQEEMQRTIEADNALKKLFVQYVGEKFKPENDKVTVEMCVHALAEEFPEFLAPISEQNFMLGYRQCEKDIHMLMQQHRDNELAESDEKDAILEEGVDD